MTKQKERENNMDNNTSLDSLFTLKETMEYLKLSRSTLYKLMEKGEIKGVKIGKVWRFKKADIDDFISRKINDQ